MTQRDLGSPGARIRELLQRAPLAAPEIAVLLGVDDADDIATALEQKQSWTPSELVEMAEALDVPSTVLSGRVPLDRHLGVSLRLGAVLDPGAPVEALERVEQLLEYKALLDSWLGPVSSPLAQVPMSTDRYHLRAGEVSAARVRDGLSLGLDPINDLVGLVESLGFPTCFMPLPQDVFGLNIRDEREGVPSRIIVISTVGPWTMQRYTLAHELCHALYDDEGQLIVDRVDVPDVLPELRAEAFARHLLLPKAALRNDVRSARADGTSWGSLTAQLMVRWGVSRRVITRALADDGLVSAAELEWVANARIDDLMTEAGMLEEWVHLCADEREPMGSPALVERAVHAYGNGWVGLRVVADLLGTTLDAAEASLQSQGWASGAGALGGQEGD